MSDSEKYDAIVIGGGKGGKTLVASWFNGIPAATLAATRTVNCVLRSPTGRRAWS